MAKTEEKTTVNDAVHRHPEIAHFLNLNTILHSLVDFIRPETYIAPDELQTYNELKEKLLHETITKQKKGQTLKSPLEIAGVESIRATSGIYRFLAYHQNTKTNSSTVKKKPKPTTSLTREELLKKLHSKMPHRQQQQENGIDHNAKRKRTKEAEKDHQKKPRISTKEWSATPSVPSDVQSTSVSKPSTIPTQITFGRFDFNTEDSVLTNSKKKKPKKFQNKQKQLINTLKQVESEQNELIRLQEENPEQGKELLRSKHWKTALAKAKGEKVRDNVQLIRKSIKKENKLRERSAKKWQQKKSETDKRMKEKQDKRQANLQKRKDDKKAKIKKRLIKKGRLVS